MSGREAYLLELDRLSFPVINYRRTTFFGLSIVDFWSLAGGLFMVAAPMMGWVHYESPSLSVAFWFAGICQYLYGFLNWYQGRTMLSFLNFIYGLLHFAFYFTADIGKYQIWVPYEYYTYMQGTFYVIWFVISLVLLIALKDRGLIYIWNMFLIALALVFVIIWEYSKRNWARKIAGYILFIASICIWLAGMGRFLTDMFQCGSLNGFYPYL